MGVTGAAIVTVGIVCIGAVVTAVVERLLVRGRAEEGPGRRALFRSDVRPLRPDPWLYSVAPIVSFAAVCLAAVVIPLSPELIAADLGIGLFYFLVVVDLVVLGIALGGWGADTRAAVEACYRVIAQLVAYIVPLGLAVLGPVMMARSLSTIDIIEAQTQADLWYVVVQPLGFALFVVTALMQTYRAPFLEPFAERIGGGVLGVYGGWQGILWRLTLSGLLLVVAAMGAVLFFGGYSGPMLPGVLWMILKTALVMGTLLVVGRRMRMRSTAETLTLSWKVLIPVGLVNVLLVGALILLGVGQVPFSASGGGSGP